jgi:DHA1 family bicyclomycin/chloramphenicol resistance-like MFS transporter
MCAFAFTSSNLSTLAMEHMAPIAGTASSVQGMLGTLGAAILGFLIGLAFDGTVVPYVIGTAACAVGGFIAIALTEPRNLFARIRKEPDEPCIPAVPEEVV